jgi:integrase
MQPKKTLTDRYIHSLKARDRRYSVSDAIVPGLAVRVTEKGTKSFVLITRYPDKPEHPTRRALGEVGELTLAEARDKAREWLSLVKRGVDPREEGRQRREAEKLKRDTTFSAVAEEYLERYQRGKRKAYDVERTFRRELLPRWKNKPVTEITRRDVVTLIDSIVDRGAKYRAHNVHAQVRLFFNWAINRGIYGLEHSPVDRLKPAQLIGAKAPRQRVLSDDELRAAWGAAERMGYPYGTLYQVLMLTGLRISEASDGRWREIDLTKKVWTIPPERFKSNATHTVPLTDEVIDILESLPRFVGGDHVFSTTGGAKPINGFSKAKSRLDGLIAEKLGAEPPPFVIHDLRRTVRTRLSSLRIPEPVAEMVVGHGRKGLARVYDQHQYAAEMREALEAWAARLRSIVDPPPDNVVQLRA